MKGIKQDFKDKLQKVYGEMLDERGIKYGDIDPITMLHMEEAEDKLATIVNTWIKVLGTL